MDTDDINREGARIATRIISIVRNEELPHVMAALTTGLAVFIARSNLSQDEADSMCEAIGVKLKGLVKRHRANMHDAKH